MMIKESGLVKKWKADWWPRQSFCSRGLITEAKAVSMTDVQGAYYLMGILLIISFIALGGEGLHRYHKSYREKLKSIHANGNAQRESSAIWTLEFCMFDFSMAISVWNLNVYSVYQLWLDFRILSMHVFTLPILFFQNGASVLLCLYVIMFHWMSESFLNWMMQLFFHQIMTDICDSDNDMKNSHNFMYISNIDCDLLSNMHCTFLFQHDFLDVFYFAIFSYKSCWSCVYQIGLQMRSIIIHGLECL